MFASDSNDDLPLKKLIYEGFSKPVAEETKHEGQDEKGPQF
jgi:hypothetical protein